jgi:hypothetical protein
MAAEEEDILDHCRDERRVGGTSTSSGSPPGPTRLQHTEADKAYMRLALQVAERALQLGEVPVGCVLVLEKDETETSSSNPVVVSHGANQVNATRDATRHAEIVAIDRLLTGSISSDQLRLPAAVLAQAAAQSGCLPANSPLWPGNDAKLNEAWQDQWEHILSKSSSSHEGNTGNVYGWGTGQRLTQKDLAQCKLYVRRYAMEIPAY